MTERTTVFEDAPIRGQVFEFVRTKCQGPLLSGAALFNAFRVAIFN